MKKASEREKRVLGLWAGVAVLCTTAYAGLPTHQVEGNSGVFITPVAYLAHPAGPNDIFGLPSVSGTYAHLAHKDFESFVMTENLWGPVELGYALERVGLGDWPDAVSKATGGLYRVQDYAFLHNFNARLQVVKDGQSDIAWVPAVTLGIISNGNRTSTTSTTKPAARSRCSAAIMTRVSSSRRWRPR